MEQMNDRPSFPNSLPVEFSLLLRRAWKQQSRDRLPQVHRRHVHVWWSLACLASCSWLRQRQFVRPAQCAMPASPSAVAMQVITLVQTLVLGFFLAALFSDIPSTLAGAQDELGVSWGRWLAVGRAGSVGAPSDCSRLGA